MRAPSRVLISLGALVALGIILLLFFARPAMTSVLAGTTIAEDPPEIRTPVVLEDPAELLAVTESRERESQRQSAPLPGANRPDAPKDTINLGHVELMQPKLGQFQEPNLFQDILTQRIAEDMKVIFPVHLACKTLHINDLRRDSAIDLLLGYENKWKKLCADAGSAATVKPVDADALRSERRDALALVTGYDEADKLLAAVKNDLGF